MAGSGYRQEYAHHLVEQVQKGQMTRRQMLVRASIFGFSAAFAGQLLVACGGDDEATSTNGGDMPDPVMGGTLRVGCRDSIVAPNPITMYDQASIVTCQQVCEYLSWVEYDMTLRPVLAESWSSDETASAWTFKLRQGVTFNDGSPFGADDVVATFERLVDPESGSAALSALGGILSPGGTEKVDDATVVFNLDRPFSEFPATISSANYNTLILPRNWGGDFIKSPVGTGPFLLDKFTKNREATFTKNPNYWQDGLPYLDGLVFKYFADPAASTLALQAGDIDMQAETPFQGSQPLFSDATLNVQEVPTTGLRQVFMRVDTDPFSDKRVRQAVAYCLDRPALIEALFMGRSTLGNDTLFSSLYPNAPEVPQRAQDYDMAKQLLSDAGYPDGITITLTPENDLEMPQYAQLIQAQCKPAGIQVDLNMMPYEQYYSGDPAPWLTVPMGLSAWSPRPVPIQFVNVMILTDSVWNSSRFANATYDKLAQDYQATVDEASRADMAKQMATIENDETPQILAFFVTQLSARSQNVYGVVGVSSFLDMSKAYLA